MHVFGLFAGVLMLAGAALAPVGSAAAQPIAAAASAESLPARLQVTQGGAGGRIIRVTSLAASGPGTLAEALAARGRRIIVFEVGGVIDLGRTSLRLDQPHVTIAGQTAPRPGITLVRGGLDVATHDVIIRHIRIYTGADGQTKRSGWEADALSTIAARNVLIEHNSFLWGIDENMSASGPRFTGASVEQWRAGTSRNIVFANNLSAEGLAEASHPKGEHSKGSLVHDNATGIIFYRNVWAHHVERHPLIKGGAEVTMINNLIYNPRHRAVHYNLMALEWVGQRYAKGRLTAIGNVLRGGNDTDPGLPFLMIGGDGDLDYHGRDNRAVDRHGNALPQTGRYGETRARIVEQPVPLSPIEGLPVLPSDEVETALLARAGARPWDRSADDVRVLFFIAEGRGQVIDDEREVGGYPAPQPSHARFVEADWDLATMEPRSGLYPGQKADAPQENISPRDRRSRDGR